MVLRLHGAHLPCSHSWKKWKELPWDENTAQTSAKKNQEQGRKEMRTLRNTWLILYLYFSCVFNGTLGLYPSLLTSKPSTMECQERGEGTQNWTALQALLSKSRSLGILRAWTLFTWLHISAGLISMIISSLFTTMPWQQGINTHRQEKDSNVNAWLQNRGEHFCLSSKKDLTSNPTRWWFPRKPLSSSNYRLGEQLWWHYWGLMRSTSLMIKIESQYPFKTEVERVKVAVLGSLRLVCLQ